MAIETNVKANRSAVRRLFEQVWNERQLAIADELLAHDYAEREKVWAATILEAFPDTHFTIEDMVAEGNSVWTHVIWRATHRGELAGIPATGKALEVPALFIHRFEHGKSIESLAFGGAVGIVDQIRAAISNA
jgi:predicted ester cyclase